MTKRDICFLAALLAALLTIESAFAQEKEQPAIKSAVEHLSPKGKLQYQTLQLILVDLGNADTTEKRSQLLGEILLQSESLKEEAQDIKNIWTWRAEAALERNEWKAGHEAAQNLIRLGVLDDADEHMTILLAKLNRRGWLEPDASKVELTELKKTGDLRPDSELSESARKDITEIINLYASGDNWGGYNKLKAVRLKVGPIEFMHFPIARRALAASTAIAAARGDRELVRHAIACGGDPNSRMNGQTALAWAAYHGDAKMVELLLTAGGDARARNKYGQSILVEPVRKGTAEAVHYLVKAGADPNVQGKEHTLILEAVLSGNSETVFALLDHGATVDGTYDIPLLYPAIQNGDVAMMTMLAQAGADPEAKHEGRDMYWHAKKMSKDMYKALKASVK